MILVYTYSNFRKNGDFFVSDFTDTADYWLYIYETEDFKAQIAELWREIRPLYLQIHAYVRRRLRKKYGEKIVSKKGPIPAHLLGKGIRFDYHKLAYLLFHQ